MHRIAYMSTVLVVFAWLSACGGADGVRFFEDRTPRWLSEWGVLEIDGATLALGDRVIAYDLNSALFSDHALKLRTVWMPEGSTASYHETEVFDLPVGTILSKTFYYPLHDAPADTQGSPLLVQALGGPQSEALGLAVLQERDRYRLLETRLLVHRERGWVALPYVWNDQQSDAELRMIGASYDLELQYATAGSPPAFDSENIRYFVPDANQCAGCHVTDHGSRALQPIGIKARHLNRPPPLLPGDAGTRIDTSQIDQWQRLGLLREPTPGADVPRAAIWWDEKSDIDQRARAYLDINCGHCHNPRGAADTSGLLLDATTSDLGAMGRCKPPIAAGRGTGNRRFGIVPGQPAESILVYRMRSRDPGIAMPELGRSASHDAGVELIASWVSSLDGECENLSPSGRLLGSG